MKHLESVQSYTIQPKFDNGSKSWYTSNIKLRSKKETQNHLKWAKKGTLQSFLSFFCYSFLMPFQKFNWNKKHVDLS